jgi:hypothetical protein
MSVAPRTIVDVMTGLWARFFPQPSFRAWLLCAAALHGLTYGLSPADQRFIADCLGLPIDQLPRDATTRPVIIVGRRGGKGRFVSALAVFAACFRDYTGILAPGERGVVMIVAPDRRQCRVVFRYIAALIDQTPMLAGLVESRTKEAIHLTNGISIEVHTASFRSVRGYTIVAANRLLQVRRGPHLANRLRERVLGRLESFALRVRQTGRPVRRQLRIFQVRPRRRLVGALGPLLQRSLERGLRFDRGPRVAVLLERPHGVEERALGRQVPDARPRLQAGVLLHESCAGASASRRPWPGSPAPGSARARAWPPETARASAPRSPWPR